MFTQKSLARSRLSASVRTGLLAMLLIIPALLFIACDNGNHDNNNNDGRPSLTLTITGIPAGTYNVFLGTNPVNTSTSGGSSYNPDNGYWSAIKKGVSSFPVTIDINFYPNINTQLFSFLITDAQNNPLAFVNNVYFTNLSYTITWDSISGSVSGSGGLAINGLPSGTFAVYVSQSTLSVIDFTGGGMTDFMNMTKTAVAYGANVTDSGSTLKLYGFNGTTPSTSAFTSSGTYSIFVGKSGSTSPADLKDYYKFKNNVSFSGGSAQVNWSEMTALFNNIP
ncbi:hypothetical protein AGMMS49546_20030 [Spirochaetia bacterium]|nr:hypothetical protein AGMMS49546_20030 [Spirochaetia bacterium]